MRTTQRRQDSRSQQIREELAINVDDLRTSKEFSNAIARATHNLSDLRKYPWDMRFECLKIIEMICERHLVSDSKTREACVEAFMDANNVRGICHAISEQLRDNRSEISKGWSQTLCALATSLGPKFSKHLKALLPPLLSHLGSGNELIRIYLDTAILTLLTHVPSAAAIKEIYAAFTYNRSKVVKELCLNYVFAIVSIWNGNRYRESHLNRLEEIISKGLICKSARGRKLAADCFLEYVEKFPSKREALFAKFPKRVQSFIESVIAANERVDSESSQILSPEKFYRKHRVFRGGSSTPSPSRRNHQQQSMSSSPLRTCPISSEGSQGESSVSSHRSTISTAKFPKSLPFHSTPKRKRGKKPPKNTTENRTPKSEHLKKYLKRKSPQKHLKIKQVVESSDTVEDLHNLYGDRISYTPPQTAVKNVKADIKELLELELSMARKKNDRKCTGGKKSRKGTRMNKVDELLFEHGFYIHQLERVLTKSNQLRESLAADDEEDVWDIVNRVLEISPAKKVNKKSPRRKFCQSGSPKSRVTCWNKAIDKSEDESQNLKLANCEVSRNWEIEERTVEKYLNKLESKLLKKDGSPHIRRDKGLGLGPRAPTFAAVKKAPRKDDIQQPNNAEKSKKVRGRSPKLKKHRDLEKFSSTKNVENSNQPDSLEWCGNTEDDLNSNASKQHSPKSSFPLNYMPSIFKESSKCPNLESNSTKAPTSDVKSLKSERRKIQKRLEPMGDSPRSKDRARDRDGDYTPIGTPKRHRKRRPLGKTQVWTPDYKKNKGNLKAKQRRTFSQSKIDVWANLAGGKSSIGSFPKSEVKDNAKLAKKNNAGNPARTKQSNTVNNCTTNVPDNIGVRIETDTSHFEKFKSCTRTKLDPERKEITDSFHSETKLNLKGLPKK